MQQTLMFKLDQSPKGLGLRCDDEGLFLGCEALLRRDQTGKFLPKSSADLQKTFSGVYGDEVDWESRIRSVGLVANALNKGELARAMMAAVLMRLPDPAGLVRIVDVDGTLGKANFNPDEARDEFGRWTTDGSATPGTSRGDLRTQLADTALSDVSDDPVAEAVMRAGAASARNPDAEASENKPVVSAHKNFWQMLGSKLSHEARSVLAHIGNAEIDESNADIAIATAESNEIASWLKDYANYRAQPWIGADGTPVEVPIINTGNPVSDQAALAERALFEPNAPLTRPATNADWIDPLINLISLGGAGAGPAFRSISEGGVVAAGASDADAPFIILPSELPENFKVGWPIGRYAIPADAAPGTTTYGDLVGDQIGKLVQSRLPDVPVILRTSPGMKGVDIEIRAQFESIAGFQFAEIKPLTGSGFRTFIAQVGRWKLPGPVHAFTYDYKGYIYYGFPFPWQR